MTPDEPVTVGELSRRLGRAEADINEQRGRNHNLASDVQAVRIEVVAQTGKIDRMSDQVHEAREDVATVARDLDGFKKAVVAAVLGMLANLVLTLIVLVLR